MTHIVISNTFIRARLRFLSCKRRGGALYDTAGAKLLCGVTWLAVLAACGAAGDPLRTVPSYDTYSRRLVQLSADQNGDGRLDQWTYLEGSRVFRGEADSDGDGRIDRWEYFDAASSLVRVGGASRGDGVEDMWTDPAPNADGVLHIARSLQRDRRMDRHEYFRGDVLLRVEEDTNADGRSDKWDRYEGAVLREVAFDTTFAAGRADRRLIYDGRGQFLAVEADPDGDGSFVRVQGTAGEPATKRGEK
jgi:hypothetical protein